MEDRSIGTVMGTVTARFPKGPNAPYLFAGGGVQFGGRTQAVGKVGGGIEHRFSPHKGIFADARMDVQRAREWRGVPHRDELRIRPRRAAAAILQEVTRGLFRPRTFPAP